MKGQNMRKLGTILPTERVLKAGDKVADAAHARREQIASRELAGCERRLVGGEVRYYDTTDQYAIVSRQGRVIWFQVTADGDFRI
jgi:hypothetical protein